MVANGAAAPMNRLGGLTILVIEEHQPTKHLWTVCLVEQDRFAIRRPSGQEVPIGGTSVDQHGLVLTQVAHDPDLQSIVQAAVTGIDNLFAIR